MLRVLSCGFLLIVLVVAPLQAAETLKVVFTYENRQIGELIDQFAANSDIQIERLWTEQGDLKVSMLELIELGNAPDVVLVPADHVGLYKPMQYSAIDPTLFRNDISDNLWNSATSEDTIYGAPIMQGNQLMLFYNKALVSEPATTWAEMATQSSAFRVNHDQHYIAWNFDEMYWFMPFFGAFGGWPITQGALTLNSSAMANALDFYRQLGDADWMDITCDYDCARAAFTAGELAYTINGDWALNEYSETLGDKLGIANIPAISADQPARPMFSTHVLAFPDDSLNGPKRDALIEFTNFMQSPDIQRELWTEMQVLPVEASAYDYALNHTLPLHRSLLKSLEFAKPMPADAAMTFAWSAMRKGYLRHKTGVMSGTDAAALMQDLAERQLTTY